MPDTSTAISRSRAIDRVETDARLGCAVSQAVDCPDIGLNRHEGNAKGASLHAAHTDKGIDAMRSAPRAQADGQCAAARPWLRAVRYVRASPLPHALALFSLAVGLVLADSALGLYAAAEASARKSLVLWGFSLGWFGLAGIALLDGFSRFREYRRIKRMLQRRGWNKRVFLLVAGSRCQRDAALLAAMEMGLGQRARGLFRSLGYRWYHLFPDAVIRNPLMFLHPRFLRSSFLPGKSHSAPDRTSSAR